MAIIHLLKIRTSIDIFKNEKCKVTFGLEYIIDTSFRRGINGFILMTLTSYSDQNSFLGHYLLNRKTFADNFIYCIIVIQ